MTPSQFDALQEHVTCLDKKLEANTKLTAGLVVSVKAVEERQQVSGDRMDRVEEKVTSVHEMLSLWESGMDSIAAFGRGLGWCGRMVMKVVVPIGKLAVAIAAIWALVWAFLHGVPPK